MNGIFSLPPAEPVKKSAPALVPLDGLERHDLVVSLHLLCAVKGLYEARLCDRRLQVAWSCGHEHDKAGAIDCACAARDRMRPLPEPPPAPHPDGATHYRPADETYHRPGPDGYITQVWRPKRKRWVDGELHVTNLSNERIFLPLPKPLEGDMQDPNDPGTLDLVEACKRPLTAAERQKRLRDKRRREREEGRRASLDLGAADLVVLGVALDEFAERWRRAPTKSEPAAALRSRLPAASAAEAFPGDTAWLPIAMGQGLDVSDWPAHSSYQAGLGMRDPLSYRQTPYGQPEVDALVKPGDQVWTNYADHPYKVLEVKRYQCEGLRCYTLVLCALTERKPTAWINELVAVDGRLLKLFANNMDEVYVVGAGALVGCGPLPEPVRQLEEERAEKNAWYQTGRELEKEVEALRLENAELRRQLEAQAAPASPALTQDDQTYLWWAVNIAEALRDDNADMAPIRERQARLFAGSWQLAQYGLDALGDELAVSGHVGFLKKEVDRAFGDVNKLREQMREAQRRHEHEERLLIDERTQAFAAAETYKVRLQAAGLSTDYRRQPGE